MSKGRITLEDAQFIHEFARAVQPTFRQHDSKNLLERAKTVARISYCAIAEARQNVRAERLRQHTFGDPYTMEVNE